MLELHGEKYCEWTRGGRFRKLNVRLEHTPFFIFKAIFNNCVLQIGRNNCSSKYAKKNEMKCPIPIPRNLITALYKFAG